MNVQRIGESGAPAQADTLTDTKLVDGVRKAGIQARKDPAAK